MRFIISALAAFVLTAFASATPITLIFSGNGTGTVGSQAFTDAAFTLTFLSDTTGLVSPSNDPGDTSTPSMTTNIFSIGSFSGSLIGLPGFGPAVFLNPNTNNVGIWYFNSGDWLLTADSTAYNNSFGLSQNLTVTNVMAIPNDGPGLLNPSPMPATVGGAASSVSFTSISDVSFQEVVGPTGASGASGPSGAPGTPGTGTVTGTAGTVPEPSTLVMIGIGFAAVCIGTLRRRRRA